MHFYVSKMAVAIALLWENAVEAIQGQNHRNKRNLNCFYTVFEKKRNSHSHFKYKKTIKSYLGIVVLVLSLCVQPNFFFCPSSTVIGCIVSIQLEL